MCFLWSRSSRYLNNIIWVACARIYFIYYFYLCDRSVCFTRRNDCNKRASCTSRYFSIAFIVPLVFLYGQYSEMTVFKIEVMLLSYLRCTHDWHCMPLSLRLSIFRLIHKVPMMSLISLSEHQCWKIPNLRQRLPVLHYNYSLSIYNSKLFFFWVLLWFYCMQLCRDRTYKLLNFILYNLYFQYLQER